MTENREPRKLVYSLTEVSRMTDLDAATVESWEREFSFLNAGETRTGKKFFRKTDLRIILRIKQLVEEQGLTLAGAKRRIESEFGMKGASLPPERLRKALFRVRDQLRELAAELDKPLLP